MKLTKTIRNLVLPCLLSMAQLCLAQQKIIFETDFGPDVDDISALGMLHALMDNGEIELIAVMHNTSEDKGVAAIDAVNTYYGRPNIPIGKYNNSSDTPWDSKWGYPWWRDIGNDTDTYGHNITGRSQVPDAVALYNSILQNQSNGSVVIVSVGHLTNLDRLLKDGTGFNLVTSKVSKLVVMGGGFPTRCGEANLTRGTSPGNVHARAATEYVIDNWPTALTFSGFEIGFAIKEGEDLKATPTISPVREAYRLHHQNFTGNSNWDWPTYDQTAVLYGARALGPGDSYWNLQANGTVVFDGNCTSWNGSANSGHAYLKKKMGNDQLGEIIEDLMVQAPAPPPGAQASYGNGGNPWLLNDGAIVQAENYDEGGTGIAYNDVDNNNNGGAYRTTERVDIQATTDSGGGHNIGWTRNGEWLEYTVNVTAGTYDLSLRVASASAGPVGDVRVKLGNNTLGTFAVSNTGGWQNWQTVTLNNVALSGGNNQVMRLEMVGKEVNINWIGFAKSADGPEPGAVYFLRNRQSGTYLTGNSDGSVSLSASNTSEAQRWELMLVGSFYQLRNVAQDAYLDGDSDKRRRPEQQRFRRRQAVAVGVSRRNLQPVSKQSS